MVGIQHASREPDEPAPVELSPRDPLAVITLRFRAWLAAELNDKDRDRFAAQAEAFAAWRERTKGRYTL